MPGFEDWLRQSFPNIRVTSGARNPNSRLGRANPKSYHNKGMAWDVAPVEGMSYQDFVNRIGQDYNVLEARDEVKNPSKHATGPHWHVAVGGRKEPQVNDLASLMQGVYPMAQQEQQGGLASLLQPAQMPNLRTDDLTNIDPQALTAGLPAKGKRPDWKNILGIIGDALATAGGGQATYAPMLEREREREELGRQKLAELMAAREQRQADREADRADWIFKRDHPGAPADAQTLAWWQSLPDEEKAAYARMQDVRNPIAVSGPQGTYRVPRGFGQQPTNQIRPGTVEDGFVYVGGDPANPSSWRQQ